MSRPFAYRLPVGLFALGICLLLPAAPLAEGWSTTVRRIDPPPGEAAPAPAGAQERRSRAPVETRKNFSLRADAPPPAEDPLYAARAPLAKGARHGPYVGAGVAPSDSSDSGSGALLGGVAAPFVADTVLFGEVQQLHRSDGEDERRLWLGVRTGM